MKFLYKCIEKDPYNKEYQFDGDLYEYLLSVGVPQAHIEKMRTTLILPEPDCYFYDFSEDTEYVSVPLDKVICFRRGSVSQSIFDNVNHIENGDRDYRRFINCFSYLNDYTLQELYQSYENLSKIDCVQMTYYVTDDFYCVTGNGNHRTLTAKLLGAPSIKAQVTNAYDNGKRVMLANRVSNFMQKYDIESVYKSRISLNSYMISFLQGYSVIGYTNELKIQDPISRLNKLEPILSHDLMVANSIRKLPKFLWKLLVRFYSNEILQTVLRLEPLNINDYENYDLRW